MYQTCCTKCSDGPQAEGCMPCLETAVEDTCKAVGKEGNDLKGCIKDQLDQLKKGPVQKCGLPPMYRTCCTKCSDGPQAEGCMPCLETAGENTCKAVGKVGKDLKGCVKDQLDQLKKMSESAGSGK